MDCGFLLFENINYRTTKCFKISANKFYIPFILCVTFKRRKGHKLTVLYQTLRCQRIHLFSFCIICNSFLATCCLFKFKTKFLTEIASNALKSVKSTLFRPIFDLFRKIPIYNKFQAINF